MLAVRLFSIAHIFARFESFEMKFSMPGISGGIVRKNKMIQLFRRMGEGKHVVLLILKNSVDPPLLVPSPLLCYVVLFCFLSFPCMLSMISMLIMWQCKPVCSLTQIQGLQTQTAYLEAKLAGGNRGRHNWVWVSKH